MLVLPAETGISGEAGISKVTIRAGTTIRADTGIGAVIGITPRRAGSLRASPMVAARPVVVVGLRAAGCSPGSLPFAITSASCGSAEVIGIRQLAVRSPGIPIVVVCPFTCPHRTDAESYGDKNSYNNGHEA